MLDARAYRTLALAWLLFAVLGAARSEAQSLRVPNEPDPIPDELSLLNTPSESSSEPRSLDPDDPILTSEEEFPFPLPADGPRAPVLSSGRILRSGRWYFEADAVMLHRNIYQDIPLATDSSPTFNQELKVSEGDPGLALTTHLTMGRNLFRDVDNRIHSTEFTFYGFGDWVAQGSIKARTDNALISDVDPFIGFADAVGGFNLADQQSFRYQSSFYSYEWNYRVSWQLGKDRLVARPNGAWVRQATPSTLYAILAGVRYFQNDENFAYQSRNTLPAGDPNERLGSLSIFTTNDLVGVQIGGLWMQQRETWNWGVRGKAGPYTNFASQRTRLEVIDPVLRTPMRDEEIDKDVIALLAELGVFARYNIRPNFAIRAAFEAVWIDTIAIAPEQINFEPVSVTGTIDTTGSAFFLGWSLGVEWVW